MDPVVGDLALSKYSPERVSDDWTQAALTVEGKIGSLDLTYAFAHLSRDVDSAFDYSEYSLWYDNYYHSLGYNSYYVNDAGEFINPAQFVNGDDRYKKRSHELRLVSPQDWRLRFLVGGFWQEQTHRILQNYQIAGLNGGPDGLSVTGWPGTLWLTNQFRTDQDEALFGEMSFDITRKLTATAGLRFFRYDNSLKGFYGFSANRSSRTGEAACFSTEQFQGAPCVNLDARVKDDDHIGRFNLTYQIDDNKMIYGTWSEGFRPGGINRVGTIPPYQPDFLTNKELGWKTTWADNTLAFNGAIFEEDWEGFQLSYIPNFFNGLTVNRNAGDARIRGLEADLSWAATYNLRLTGGFAFYDAELTTDFCGFNDANGDPVTSCEVGDFIDAGDDGIVGTDDDNILDEVPAASGTRLPVTPEFKGNLIRRYMFDIGSMEAYVQGAVIHVGERRANLIEADNVEVGDLSAYTTLDLSAGIRRDNWALDFYIKNVTDERGELAKFAQCSVCTMDGLIADYPTGQVYEINTQPRTFGIRFSQDF
jgi:outer membrane receptor protein involved in Fe transport